MLFGRQKPWKTTDDHVKLLAAYAMWHDKNCIGCEGAHIQWFVDRPNIWIEICANHDEEALRNINESQDKNKEIRKEARKIGAGDTIQRTKKKRKVQ